MLPYISLIEIDDKNREAVCALAVAPEQEQFVGTVSGALQEAVEWSHAKPWYRAIYTGETPVGFMMLSWNVEPDPPEIYGPWFLWKLLIDARFQRRGFGRATVELVADLVRAEGARQLLTSYVEGEGSPEPFYRKLGFHPTGERDVEGEIILTLQL